MEHRWGERLSVRSRVTLRVGGGLRGIGYLRDVSVSGARIVTGLRASPMAFIRIVLPGGASTSALSIEGRVVRHTADGFAVEWCELAPEVVRAFGPAEAAATQMIEHPVSSRARGAVAR